MQIELWAQIFKDFKQVKKVSVDFSAEILDITIESHKEVLNATLKELNYSLYDFNSNPHEVVTSFLKKHNILVYYQNTLVGNFDIQAYSSFIKLNKIVKAIQKVTHCLQIIKSMATTNAFAVKLDHWILSDSIIIVVDTNRHPLFSGSLMVFLQTCSMILRISMINGLPLRGAIGGGDFYKDGEIMVSSALVDAVEYEKEQDWLGAVLTPTALQVIETAKNYEITNKGETNIDFSSNQYNFCVRYGDIPWKLTSDFAKEEDSRQMHYIKAYMVDVDDEAKKNWASIFLPPYFDAPFKINNSHRLYAEE
ncbi:MAG: hypothetical protein WC443_09820 [Desulfobaccales bacterium]